MTIGNTTDRTDKRGGDFDKMDPDKMKKKLAKLVALQESAEKVGNINEAEMLSQRISELFAKYEFTEDDIGSPVIGMTLFDPIFHELTRAFGRIEWQVVLATAVAEYTGCRVLFPEDRKNNQLFFVGTTRDRQTCINLFQHLCRLGNSFSKAEFSLYKKSCLSTGRTPNTKNYRGSFLDAFVNTVVLRLKEFPTLGNIDALSEFISNVYGNVSIEKPYELAPDHEVAAATAKEHGETVKLTFKKREKAEIQITTGGTN